MITPVEINSTTDGTMPAVRYPVALRTSALVLTVVAFAGFGWVISDPSHAAKIARDQSTRMALTIGALTVLAISFAAWLSVLRWRRRWRIDLKRAVGERRQAEEALRRVRDELEVLIAQRTAELGKTNQALQTENSEGKQTEETIRRERDFSQAALDSLPGLFYLFDDQGRFLRWNKNLERVSGYSADELSRMTPLDFLGETDKGRSAAAIQRVFQTGEATVEVDFLPKDQTKIPFLFTGKLSHVDQKSCVMGMGIDITERKRAEEALRASQQIIEGILNAIPVRVFWKDKNLVFLGCNAVFARDAGFGDPKDIIGKDDSQMGWHDQAEAYRKDDRHTIESGNSKFNIEESQTTPDGKTITVLTSKIPLRNSTGQISGVLGTYVDITERKQAEAALEKVNQELVGASRQAGMAEVATSVLHNVGNVLNSVGVSATLVANQVYHSKAANIAKLAALLDQHQADLATFLTTDSRGQTIPAYLASLAESLAAEQTMLLAELGLLRKNIEHIKDIVSLQQANAHTSGVTEPISLPDLLEEALRMNADALARYNVTTIRDYQTRPVVTTDQNRVLQILVNLVRNAKLACVDSGRTDKQITVRTTSDDRNAKIAIIDNGVGIPAENLTRIFHHGFTTRKTGHGFGLHSAALAAKQLGGALTVQSDGPGRGATFTLELPCQLAPPAHENSIR